MMLVLFSTGMLLLFAVMCVLIGLFVRIMSKVVVYASFAIVIQLILELITDKLGWS